MSFDITPFSSNLAWWEGFSGWVLALLVSAAAIETILKFRRVEEKFPKLEKWLGWLAALALLFGSIGEVVSHSNRTINTAKIVATLDANATGAHTRVATIEKEAADLKKQASAADERTAAINKTASDALKSAAEANLAAANIREQAAKTEVVAADLKAKNMELEKSLASVRRDVVAREISDDLWDRFIENISGKKRPITLILPNDQEARAFGAMSVKPMLEEAGFTVKISNLDGTSFHAGLFICDNGSGEVKLFRAFQRAKIAARKFDASKGEWPEFCRQEFGSVPTFRIFVGQRMARTAQ